MISSKLRPPYVQRRTLDINFICGWVDASGRLSVMGRRQFFPRRESDTDRIIQCLHILHTKKCNVFKILEQSAPFGARRGGGGSSL